VYFQFPELKDFISYLKAQNIDRVGIVERLERKTTKHGVPITRYFFRLTAKDKKQGEIVLCDITYYHDVEFERDKEKVKKAHDEVEEEIRKAFEEEAAKGIIFNRIKAEFTPKPITV
jgi:hypothetical protein